jgi:hypothetical protein
VFLKLGFDPSVPVFVGREGAKVAFLKFLNDSKKDADLG